MLRGDTCELCTSLLLDYIAAANSVLEARRQLRRQDSPKSRIEATVLLHRATNAKREIRACLAAYQGGLSCICANRQSAFNFRELRDHSVRALNCTRLTGVGGGQDANESPT